MNGDPACVVATLLLCAVLALLGLSGVTYEG